MNLGSLFTSIGDAGSQAADAKLKTDQFKLEQLFSQLGLKQGQATLDETLARTKKLGQPVPTEADNIQQTVDAVEKALGRKLTDTEKQNYLGIAPTPPKPVKEPTNKEEMWYEAFIRENKRPPSVQEIEARQKSEQKAASPSKPSKTVTYDPSGHLRESWVDPATGKVSAWGPLAEAKAGLYHYKDDDGNIHEVPTFKPNVKPGEIRMTDEARKVWDEELHGQDHYARAPVKNKEKTTNQGPKLTSADTKTPTPSSGGGRIIGNAGPKDTMDVKGSLKETKQAYASYLDAMKNVSDGGSKGQLALAIAAARSSVLGAGRLNLAEIKMQMEFGSYGRKWQRAMELATEGKLPQADVDEFLAVIKNSWQSKAEVTRGLWKDQYKDKAMPSFLNVPDTPKGTATPGAAGAPPPGAKITSLDDFLKEK
jgi:hypothetical protein